MVFQWFFTIFAISYPHNKNTLIRGQRGIQPPTVRVSAFC